MRRLRLRTGPTALFGAMLVAALLLFLPMRLALGWIGLGEEGFSARSVEGSVWDGRLVEARFGDLSLGTLHAGVSPLALLIGRARIGLEDDLGGLRGAITISRHRRALDHVTATLPTGRVFAPLPVTSLILEDLTIRFADASCEAADGRVRATLVGDAGGVPLPTQLSGNARCDGTALLLPLASQAGTEGVELRVTADGHYSAQMRIAATDPVAAERLAAAGFTPSGSGYRLTIQGSF
ncbi:type II secretion system protein N [Sphingomonas beigongshangi]|uniref:type II secretion system protein N n=1 Tax=Sphingomonas beigongshangi TaxID=2782540 RepID=UPI001AEE0762|nr:type II secretion system protein N [Sphingomonas beigongshangi]